MRTLPVNRKNPRRGAVRVAWGALWLALFTGSVRGGDAYDEDAAREERLRSYRAVLEELNRTTEVKVVLSHLRVLEGAFPESRSVLVEGSRHSKARVRMLSVKILGEFGNVEQDLESIAKNLRDPVASVRMAAVIAIRTLGSAGIEDTAGIDAMDRLLRNEFEKNIRKMAVRNLELWKDPRAVPHLVRALDREEEASVRKFIVRALERLTKKRLGDDVPAWIACLDHEHAMRMKEYGRALQRKRARERAATAQKEK